MARQRTQAPPALCVFEGGFHVCRAELCTPSGTWRASAGAPPRARGAPASTACRFGLGAILDAGLLRLASAPAGAVCFGGLASILVLTRMADQDKRVDLDRPLRWFVTAARQGLSEKRLSRHS